MGLFRIYLTGSQQSLDVELAVSDLQSLKRGLLNERYLEGRVQSADGDVECMGVLIPAAKLELILEL